MAIRSFFEALCRKPKTQEELVSARNALDRPHMLLLTRFLLPINPEQLDARRWGSVLGEPVASAVKRFVETGLITEASTSDKLEHSLSSKELPAALMQARLKRSGSKADLAKRLANERPAEAANKVAGITAVRCTERGQAVAAESVAADREERKIAEDAVIEALARNDLKTAADAVVRFERAQVFDRGLNVKWDEVEARRLAAEVEAVYRAHPTILHAVSEEILESLRPRAAVMVLWGENRLRQKLEISAPLSGRSPLEC
jgi:hypothetical protein